MKKLSREDTLAVLNCVAKENIQTEKMPDFDLFWKRKIAECIDKPLGYTEKERKYPVPGIKVFDITFKGLDGNTIYGEKVLPWPMPKKKIPFVIHLHAHMSGMPRPYEALKWLNFGAGFFSFDYREQNGLTGRGLPYKSGFKGKMGSWGILDREDYYLCRLITDSIRGINIVLGYPELDSRKVFLQGNSQGGGMAMYASSLFRDKIRGVMLHSPGFCGISKFENIRNNFLNTVIEFAKQNPSKKKKIMRTLTYFDGTNFAPNAKAAFFIGIGLKDKACVPKGFINAYNKISSKKEILIYPNSGHEGGGVYHEELKLEWFKKNI